jgi:hypothetical protein
MNMNSKKNSFNIFAIPVAVPLAVAVLPLFSFEFPLVFVVVRLPSLAQSAVAVPPLAVAVLPLFVSAQPAVAIPVAVPLAVAVPVAVAAVVLPLFSFAPQEDIPHKYILQDAPKEELEIVFYLKPLRDSKMTGLNVIRTQLI